MSKAFSNSLLSTLLLSQATILNFITYHFFFSIIWCPIWKCRRSSLFQLSTLGIAWIYFCLPFTNLCLCICETLDSIDCVRCWDGWIPMYWNLRETKKQNCSCYANYLLNLKRVQSIKAYRGVKKKKTLKNIVYCTIFLFLNHCVTFRSALPS